MLAQKRVMLLLMFIFLTMYIVKIYLSNVGNFFLSLAKEM